MSLLNLSPTDTHEKWYYMTFFMIWPFGDLDLWSAESRHNWTRHL